MSPLVSRGPRAAEGLPGGLAGALALCFALIFGTPGCGGGPAEEGIATGEWPAVGGDAHGLKFSPLDQVDRGNVGDLRLAWTYRTGEAEVETRARPRFSATPIVVEGTMYLGTPLGRVIALDPETGRELWAFDPEVDRTQGYGDFTNRGVATWVDREAPEGAPCRRRVFVATIDARLFAIDGRTGRACADFGEGGRVDLRRGLRIPPLGFSAYQVTSPPVVVRDLVITGSAIADNVHVAPASGEVRAWDARTGELRWSWDPIPQDPEDPAYGTWTPGSAETTGGGNVWSVMSADPGRGLVFLPTTSPAPDYYGGLRIGQNRHASSIVALRAESGEVAWSFQTVHHDLWDYDNPAQPALATLWREEGETPVVLAVTKTGQLFVLHRETGEPVFPVEERPVPASDVPREEAWPVQPFSRDIEPLSPQDFSVEEVWGPTEEDRAACREMVFGLRNEGIFTPPSLEGSLVIPGNIGGAHWGGLAFHPERQIAVIPVNRFPAVVRLIPKEEFDGAPGPRGPGEEYTAMRETPYVMHRRILLSPSGFPCSPPPFGALVAVDLRTGERAWEVPLGSAAADGAAEGPDPDAGAEPLGLPNLGGPIVTGGGLAFIAATPDNLLRAFDLETGEELWRGELPAGGRATPMTYRGPRTGHQFVVVAAGGEGEFWERGDYVVAFALP